MSNNHLRYLRYLSPAMTSSDRNILIGIGLAVLAVIIWSGNFIIARGVIKQIPPVSLAFYRWLSASIIILPFASKHIRPEWKIVKRSWHYLFWASLTGIALFNTFVYIGAHYTTATNLALIGTTTAPVIAIVLAKIFLKEKIGWLKMAGMALCISGVIFLLSGGSLQNLVSLNFTKGDGWILLAAFSFAVYNTLVRKKPSGISPVNYLFVIFSFGMLLLLPFYCWELASTDPVKWNAELMLIVLYLGAGASLISFLCWNIAIGKLGAGRTALFGNLIPVFSSVEAALLLNEEFTWIHVVSMLLVFAGILMANWQLLKR
ncbi:MAG TPA: DMT family transporter [Chitinophagaceae bacterium]|nr:DMT family transporter [Chitinophagaceae bacterium]